MLQSQTVSLPYWAQKMGDEIMSDVLEKIKSNRLQYFRYRDDPIGFGEDILGYHYTEDVKNMMRSVLESPITLAKSSNGTGKTHSAASLAVWWYTVFPESKVFVTAAPPEQNLRNLLWGEINAIQRKHAELFEGDHITELRVERHGEYYITGVTIPMTGTSEERQGRFSGKHSPYLLFIVDEGDAVPIEVYRGIEACMSGGFARLLVLYNPRGKRGPVYEMESSGRARIVHLSALRHPNVVTGEDIIPGAVSREATVRRINEWTRPVVSGEEPDSDKLFEVPDFLVGVVADDFRGIPYPPLPAGKRVITELGFSYMVLGQYPAQGLGQLIEADKVDAAMKRWKEYQKIHGDMPPTGKPRMGLDVAEFGQDFNVPILRYGDYVADIERIWQGVDPIQTADNAAGICQRLGVDMVYVDGTGAGSGVAPAIARQLRGTIAISVKVAGKPNPIIKSELGDFFQLRDQLWWICREWIHKNPNAMLPPNYMLREELITPAYYIDLRGKIHIMDKDTMREKLKRSPNFADALVLTFTPMERAKVRKLEG